jgi:DeoR family transcriptional regulator, suf operon transcriptional repressor
MAGTRGRIIDLLRRSPATAPEIASTLQMTYNAVRSHLGALHRDGLVQMGGMQRGGTRPAVLYELAPGVNEALSRAYVPFLTHVLRELGVGQSQGELEEFMRRVGRRLAGEWTRPRGSVRERVEAASALLKTLGGPNEIETSDGTLTIRGFGCLLHAAVAEQPAVCRAMESLLQELLEVPVTECCERGERPRCCFAIAG